VAVRRRWRGGEGLVTGAVTAAGVRDRGALDGR